MDRLAMVHVTVMNIAKTLLVDMLVRHAVVKAEQIGHAVLLVVLSKNTS